jgi:hypothetical protein
MARISGILNLEFYACTEGNMADPGDNTTQSFPTGDVRSSEEEAMIDGSGQGVASWPDEPFLNIWVKPRGTMRAIVDSDPKRYIHLLAILLGIEQALGLASDLSVGDSTSLPAIFLFAVFVGAILGFIYLYVGGAILRWTGSLLGGEATSTDVRAAVAWSSVPVIVSLLLWIPLVALYGNEMFGSTTPRMDASPWGLLIISILQVASGFWALFILLKTLGEVHRFSAWRGLLTYMIPLLAFGVVLFGCNLLAAVLG